MNRITDYYVFTQLSILAWEKCGYTEFDMLNSIISLDKRPVIGNACERPIELVECIDDIKRLKELNKPFLLYFWEWTEELKNLLARNGITYFIFSVNDGPRGDIYNIDKWNKTTILCVTNMKEKNNEEKQ